MPSAAAAAASTLAALVDPGGTAAWLSDLAVHWQWVYLAAALAVAPLVAIVDPRGAWIAAVCVVVCATCCMQAAPALPRAATSLRGGEPVLKVISANVYLGNADLGRVSAWIAQHDPDVVFMQEVAAAAVPQLSTLRYRHVLLKRPIESYGVVVLSKYPLHDVQVVELMGELEGHRISHRARLDWNGRSVAVAAVHLAAPTSARFQAARDGLLDDTVRWAGDRKQPALIVGDLNATPWSRALKRAAAAGMRRATSLAPTWPVAGLPDVAAALVPTLIPIDQVLGSRHWAVVERRVGPTIGSDHRPVLVSLALRDPGKTDR